MLKERVDITLLPSEFETIGGREGNKQTDTGIRQMEIRLSSLLLIKAKAEDGFLIRRG